MNIEFPVDLNYSLKFVRQWMRKFRDLSNCIEKLDNGIKQFMIRTNKIIWLIMKHGIPNGFKRHKISKLFWLGEEFKHLSLLNVRLNRLWHVHCMVIMYDDSIAVVISRTWWDILLRIKCAFQKKNAIDTSFWDTAAYFNGASNSSILHTTTNYRTTIPVDAVKLHWENFKRLQK